MNGESFNYFRDGTKPLELSKEDKQNSFSFKKMETPTEKKIETPIEKIAWSPGKVTTQ